MNTNALPFSHPSGFRFRRFLNWFPLGLSYALLYMGRYNLTVAKTSLGELMTKEDFGIIFGTGTFVYAFAFLLNGPLVDRWGGRLGMLLALVGSTVANLVMGLYLVRVLDSPDPTGYPLRMVFSLLYGANMYFQSFGAVSIVKVNAHWFHVRERGGFSGIFGTMISSGIFLAFTVNGWLLDLGQKIWPGQKVQWIVFLAPSALLGLFFVLEFFLLKDQPSDAGLQDFDTGDASSGEALGPSSVLELYKRILTNPIIMTIALIEFCTGVVRNGVMHWFPIYAKEVWVLPGSHWLMYGAWDQPLLTAILIGVAIVSFVMAKGAAGSRRGFFAVMGSLAFLAPFFQGGWGGILFVAGVIGGNVAGWVSDLFFQSRRAPSAAGLYVLLTLCMVGMLFTLSPPTNVVQKAKETSGLLKGDKIIAIAGVEPIFSGMEIGPAVACFPARCKNSTWNSEKCMCVSGENSSALSITSTVSGMIPVKLERDGVVLETEIPDPKPVQEAGDRRQLAAQPETPISPAFLGVLVFLMSLCVIGAHGLLSGTATMDFGGRKGAATAVGVIDGFVYLGTALQSVALGYITTRNWAFWPVFLLPFGVMGTYLLTRIWHAKPGKKGGH